MPLQQQAMPPLENGSAAPVSDDKGQSVHQLGATIDVALLKRLSAFASLPLQKTAATCKAVRQVHHPPLLVSLRAGKQS